MVVCKFCLRCVITNGCTMKSRRIRARVEPETGKHNTHKNRTLTVHKLRTDTEDNSAPAPASTHVDLNERLTACNRGPDSPYNRTTTLLQ